MIYLRESVRDNWRTKKSFLGYAKLTDSEFAEVFTAVSDTVMVYVSNTCWSFIFSNLIIFECIYPLSFVCSVNVYNSFSVAYVPLTKPRIVSILSSGK